MSSFVGSNTEDSPQITTIAPDTRSVSFETTNASVHESTVPGVSTTLVSLAENGELVDEW